MQRVESERIIREMLPYLNNKQFEESNKLQAEIKDVLKELGYEI